METFVFKKAEFVKSIKDIKNKPEISFPEIAFAGRSNVGKSSLMNAILNRKKLVKISSTPGKTQLINYFLINDKFYFVDLPGYGYASLPKSILKSWQKMIESYLLKNSNLRLAALLIDSRHNIMNSDLQMAEWLDHNRIPFIIVLTKTDKLSKNKLQRQLKIFNQAFPDHHVIPFSIKSLDYIINFSNMLMDFIK
jgi:GTP-binding protein